MALASGLYDGEISDARAAPRNRWRRRRAVMLLVDLDEAAALERRLRLFSVRRLGLASKTEVEAELARAGLGHGGPVRVLCARGFAAYLCHAPDGALSAIRYAVRTGGEARSWLVPASMESGMARLYASGPADRAYSLRLAAPGETVQIALDAAEPIGGFAFATTFMGRRRALSDWALLGAAVSRVRELAAGVADILQAWQAADAPAGEARLAA